MVTAAERYAAYVDAEDAQRQRVHGGPPPEDLWGGTTAQRFRGDPHRELDANLGATASYLEPGDVLIDVGGGAGRFSLPLALRCRQVINVEPSAGMGAQFQALAAEAGIANARFIHSDWLRADGVRGDVTLAANVTYFVRDIVPFIEKLEAASRRRVIITIWSVPPPDQSGRLFRLVYGEEHAPLPGQRDLLPVLWEMGVLPDVRVLPGVPPAPGSPTAVRLPQTRQEAVALALQGIWLAPQHQDRARGLVETHFLELFCQTPDGFRPLWQAHARELLITWETGRTP